VVVNYQVILVSDMTNTDPKQPRLTLAAGARSYLYVKCRSWVSLWLQRLDEPHSLYPIAARTATPRNVLERLSRHPQSRVRACVAGNQSCPPALLEHLLRDTKPSVAHTAASNPNLPRATLAMWQLSSLSHLSVR